MKPIKQYTLTFLYSYTTARCEKSPEYIKHYWGEAVRFLNSNWSVQFANDYSQEEMIEDIVGICLPNANTKGTVLTQLAYMQGKARFWYDQDETQPDSIRWRTIALLETINHFYWHDAPVPLTMSREMLLNVLGCKIDIDYDNFVLMLYDFEKFINLISEGMKWRLGQWIGGKEITREEWIFLKKHDFPFDPPNDDGYIGIPFFMTPTKVKDLNDEPLKIQLRKSWKCRKWEETKTEEKCWNLFYEIQEETWQMIIESTRYTWGG